MMLIRSAHLLLLLATICFVHARPAGDPLGAALQNVMDAVSHLFEGSATFFHPVSEGGPIGSCGPRESDKSRIVALNKHQYGDMSAKSAFCGKEVLIICRGKWTTAKITDACPGCEDGSLDLTPTVFGDIADPVEGVVPIKWCVIGENGCKKPSSAKGGSKKHGHHDKDDENT